MARRATRMLAFPVRLSALSDEMLRKAAPSPPISVSGQFEIFPDPERPDPYSPSELILRFTALQIEVVRLASDASPQERWELSGDYQYVMERIRTIRERIANWRESEAEAWHRRIRSA